MGNYIGKICPFCKTEIKEEDNVKVCPACNIPHHSGCWEENKGCSSPNCSQHNTLEGEPATGVEQNAIMTEKKCTICGAIFNDGDLFCPSCGNNTAVTHEANRSIEEFNRNITNAKKKKKRFLTIWLPIIVCAVIAGIVVSWFLYFAPNAKYQEAKEMYTNGDYESAISLFKELGGFKDSEEQIINCENAIKQEKYDDAIKLFENNNHFDAIEILLSLEGFSDSESKIAEIKNDYLSDAQIAYALISRGYDLDKVLGGCVYNTLLYTDLYDADISTAMSRLYSGSSYMVYYYWSRYANGYTYVVDADTAQAFENSLSIANQNMSALELIMLELKHAPEEYKKLYSSLNELYKKYEDYHNYINKRPSVAYSTYYSSKDTKEKSVDNAISNVKKQNSKITSKVSEYKWD